MSEQNEGARPNYESFTQFSESISELDPKERAQVETTNKIGRSLADKLNNDLALPTGYLDLVLDDPALPVHLKEMLNNVADGLMQAGTRANELTSMKRFVQTEAPGGQQGVPSAPMLDWDKSLQATRDLNKKNTPD